MTLEDMPGRRQGELDDALLEGVAGGEDFADYETNHRGPQRCECPCCSTSHRVFVSQITARETLVCTYCGATFQLIGFDHKGNVCTELIRKHPYHF